MTAVVLLTGVMFAGGVTLVIREFWPSRPQLAAAMSRLVGQTPQAIATHEPRRDLKSRIGYRFAKHVDTVPGVRIPHRDLAVLGMSTHSFVGEKVILAIFGLVAPAIFALLATVLRLSIPVAIPAIAGPILAIVLSFLPDVSARRHAAAARADFTHVLSGFVDLVALERAAGAGVTQALEEAARVGNTWVFERVREDLDRARWSGQPPWDSLAELGRELGLAELEDVADVMRLSGEEGTAAYGSLRARARSMRGALLADERQRANRASESMAAPVGLLCVLFLAVLAVPSIFRLMT